MGRCALILKALPPFGRLMSRPIFLLLVFLSAGLVSAQAEDFRNFGDWPPRAVAALEQGQAAEQGVGERGGKKNFPLAITLYCDAAQMGIPEGFFRVARLLATEPHFLRNPALANAYLALAARLGHQTATDYYDANVGNALLSEQCGDFLSALEMPAKVPEFDLDAYVAAQPLAKRKIADLIRRNAPRYNIDIGIALGVALVESNLDSKAVSSRNAQGVMQLIPLTQMRFGVNKPFDPENNVRGGLAYLKWLKGRFGDDWALIAAAYNTGEGTIIRHNGIPPFPETQRYVQRVLYFAGLTPPEGVCSDNKPQRAASRPKKAALSGLQPQKSEAAPCWRAVSL